MSCVHPDTAAAAQQQAYSRLCREFRRTPIRLDVIQACFQAGVPIDDAGRSGVTALMAATSAGRYDIVLSLLRLGANPNCCSRRGDTALHYAAERGMTGMRRCIRSLVAHGADVNAVDRHGMTPLMRAATCDYVANMRTLVACGAAVDRVNLNGFSAFRLAAISCKIHVMQWLLKYGVDINARDKSGATALLDVMHQRDYPWIVPELIAAGADPMAADARGQTALDSLDRQIQGPLAKRAVNTFHDAGEHMRAALEDSLMRFWTAPRRAGLLKALGAERATRLLPRCMAAQAVRETARDWQRPAVRVSARRSP